MPKEKKLENNKKDKHFNKINKLKIEMINNYYRIDIETIARIKNVISIKNKNHCMVNCISIKIKNNLNSNIKTDHELIINFEDVIKIKKEIFEEEMEEAIQCLRYNLTKDFYWN